MVTLRDVATLGGVSVSVASRVLTGDPNLRIRPDTKARVLEAAKTLKYIPNSTGRSLRTSRTNLLALIVPDVTNATFSDLATAVEDEALHHGYSVLLGSSSRIQPGTTGFVRLVQERRVDGVILQKRDEVDSELLSHALGEQSNVLLLNSGKVTGFATLALDDHSAGALAAQHLIELGHREIAFAGGLASSDSSGMREKGSESELSRNGIELPAKFRTRLGYTFESGRDAARILLTRQHKPTAIIVANVNAGFGVLVESEELGIDVPRELSVVALHDVWEAEITKPKLTTVKMPMAELGRHAVERIMSMIAGEQNGHTVLYEPVPELIERQSTGACVL